MNEDRLNAGSLRGVWAALLTPWAEEERLDEAKVVAEVRSYAAAGVHGVYTGGTSGEHYAQDDASFARLTKVVCRAAGEAGVPVQIGCTALSTRTVVSRIEVAAAEGADAVQLALPFWLALNDQEVLQFFADVASAGGKMPLVLYQTLRAKRRIDPPLLGHVSAATPTLIGVKDTLADLPTFQAMRRDAPHLSIFGADCRLIERIRHGGRGTYSSLVGLSPAKMLHYFHLCEQGRFADASLLEDLFRRLMNEVLLPMVRDEGLNDSAVDRVQRAAGTGNAGDACLRCAKPYRSAKPEHVTRVIDWCRRNAPALLPGQSD